MKLQCERKLRNYSLQTNFNCKVNWGIDITTIGESSYMVIFTRINEKILSEFRDRLPSHDGSDGVHIPIRYGTNFSQLNLILYVLIS